GLDAHLAQGFHDEAVAVVVPGQSDIRDGGKFRVIARFFGNVSHVIRQRLGVLRRASNRKRVNESARAVAAITVVHPRRIPGKREFRYANRLFDAIPDARLPEYLRAVRPNSSTPAGQPRPRASTWNGDMVG